MNPAEKLLHNHELKVEQLQHDLQAWRDATECKCANEAGRKLKEQAARIRELERLLNADYIEATQTTGVPVKSPEQTTGVVSPSQAEISDACQRFSRKLMGHQVTWPDSWCAEFWRGAVTWIIDYIEATQQSGQRESQPATDAEWKTPDTEPEDGESIWIEVQAFNRHVDYAVVFRDVDGLRVRRFEQDVQFCDGWPATDVLTWRRCDVPDPDVERATETVLRWAWQDDLAPSHIHDAAALALDEPSLAHGCYSPSQPEPAAEPEVEPMPEAFREFCDTLHPTWRDEDYVTEWKCRTGMTWRAAIASRDAEVAEFREQLRDFDRMRGERDIYKREVDELKASKPEPQDVRPHEDMRYHDQFQCSPAQYHAVVDRLWEALGLQDAPVQDVDVFTQAVEAINERDELKAEPQDGCVYDGDAIKVFKGPWGEVFLFRSQTTGNWTVAVGARFTNPLKRAEAIARARELAGLEVKPPPISRQSPKKS